MITMRPKTIMISSDSGMLPFLELDSTIVKDMITVNITAATYLCHQVMIIMMMTSWVILIIMMAMRMEMVVMMTSE